MKFLIALVIVVGLSLGAYQLHEYWVSIEKNPAKGAASVPAPPPPAVGTGSELPGLPQSLEYSLNDAEQRGAAALKQFLTANASAIKDPRRAWIELDYVVLEGASDPGEARLYFRKVQARLTPKSPVYARMKQLAQTYE